MKRRLTSALVSALTLASMAGLAAAGPDAKTPNERRIREPIVIAHRGASGYRPEHTLEAYELAIDMGADYIEPDLVSTKDHVLVARHENEISATTDVENHPEFANRRATKTIDGVAVTGWFTEDFTLAELRTLRVEERIPSIRPDNTAFNGLYQVPTLQEVIDLAKTEGVGIYPETKHPTYFDSIGLSLEEPLVEVLSNTGYTKPKHAVYVQSFEVENLQDLDRMTNVRLVQLLSDTGAPYDFVAAGDDRTYADMATDEGLEDITEYADGIGANKNLIIPRDSSNHLAAETTLVRRAHDEGLVVHAWTFRRENVFLPADFRAGDPASPVYLRAPGDAPSEYFTYFATGLDGVFSDNPDIAVAARTEMFGWRPGLKK